LGVLCGQLLSSRTAFIPPPTFWAQPHRSKGTNNPAGACVGSCATVLSGSAAWAMPPASMPIAPSGVNGLPESQQALIVGAILVGLLADSYLLVALFGALRAALPEGWFQNWQKTWPLAGLVYVVAGSAHFTAAGAFESIYPPQGTWGLWYLPGSPEFHVAWTGVAEILGGVGLFGGAAALLAADAAGVTAPPVLRQLHALSALGLCLLTLVVTPANVYMYTHGAQMVGLTPGDQPIPVEGHYARAVLQVILLSILWEYYRFASPPPEGEGTPATN